MESRFETFTYWFCFIETRLETLIPWFCSTEARVKTFIHWFCSIEASFETFIDFVLWRPVLNHLHIDFVLWRSGLKHLHTDLVLWRPDLKHLYILFYGGHIWSIYVLIMFYARFTTFTYWSLSFIEVRFSDKGHFYRANFKVIMKQRAYQNSNFNEQRPSVLAALWVKMATSKTSDLVPYGLQSFGSLNIRKAAPPYPTPPRPSPSAPPPPPSSLSPHALLFFLLLIPLPLYLISLHIPSSVFTSAYPLRPSSLLLSFLCSYASFITFYPLDLIFRSFLQLFIRFIMFTLFIHSLLFLLFYLCLLFLSLLFLSFPSLSPVSFSIIPPVSFFFPFSISISCYHSLLSCFFYLFHLYLLFLPFLSSFLILPFSFFISFFIILPLSFSLFHLYFIFLSSVFFFPFSIISSFPFSFAFYKCHAYSSHFSLSYMVTCCLSPFTYHSTLSYVTPITHMSSLTSQINLRSFFSLFFLVHRLYFTFHLSINPFFCYTGHSHVFLQKTNKPSLWSSSLPLV